MSINTVNPPGGELPAAQYLGGILEQAGFKVSYYPFADQRTNLIALLEAGREPALCFCGHLDTVPLGHTTWSGDPFSGDRQGDRLYGRGASDMKSGVAAMVVAAVRIAAIPGRNAPLVLILTAGEETGCQGAHFLVRQGVFPVEVGAMVVGEPTGNYPLIGHKGTLWLECRTSGVSAHGSMPEKGVNAIHKAADVVMRMGRYSFQVAPHPILGGPTLNVGTISGGTKINMVPDEALVGVDIRMIPGQSRENLMADLSTFLGQEVTLKPLVATEAVITDPQNDWVQKVFRIMTQMMGEAPEPRTAPYFTDASALTPAFGHPPTLILGPGQPEAAHKVDEFCYVHKIEEAVQAYFEIAGQWCGI
jgi:succinyl-diaminopimelate desuccinylase